MTHFDDYATAYDAWFMENQFVLNSELLLVKYFLADCGETLSVGCGSGLFEKLLRDEHGIDIRHGIEPSSNMADIAVKRGMQVQVKGAEDAEFGESCYDTIMFNGSPGYISDLPAVLAKSYAALKPGGKIILIDVPKESGYATLYNLAMTLGTWDHPLLEGVKPKSPYPIELVKVAKWRTTQEKIDLMQQADFTDFRYAQTLTRHPVFSDDKLEQPTEGFDGGDYVAICAYKSA
ncbi:class I SAM-dependent methyltransferase [Vibrio sp. JC009]|uniref:class I SAM-dependent DNA methyltransferase n=1 Tax=Vibrio sp. JC009 TaxID=2912314 RepID=UPI0023B1509B|nr:class I SAM-dependent methyltransferase [Vibrio sp. JC009]WED24747.1 class I SAM-dependent methyltransferase [Vibrio sp. JC009]